MYAQTDGALAQFELQPALQAHNSDGLHHQSIISVFETMTTPDKKGKKQSPIVDAGDVQKLMLCLPYVLDGLA